MADVDLRYVIDAVDKGFSSTLTKLGRTTQQTAGIMEGHSNKATVGYGKTHGILGKVGSAASLMGKAALAGGVALGGIAFAKLAGDGLQMANSLETAKMGFTTMLGSAEKADKFVRQMADFAAKTPFEFPELNTAAQRMLAFGFSAEDVIPNMTAIGDAVAALGGTSETVDRVTTALGQMKAKHKVSAEEMLQLTEAGIPAWDILASRIGVSVPKAMEMAKKGQLDLDETMTAIIGGMGERYAGGMAKQAETMTGIMSTLKDNVGLALAKIIEPFMPAIKGVLSGLANFAGSAGDSISGAMEKIRPVVTRVFDYMKTAAASWMPKLREVWAAMVDAFHQARPGLENIGKLLAGVGKAMMEYVIPFLIEVGKVLLPMMIRAWGELGKYLPTVVAAFIDYARIFVSATASMADGFLAAIEWILKGLGKLPGELGEPFRNAGKSVEEFRDKVTTGATKMIDGMDKASAALKRMGEEARKPKEAKLTATIDEGMTRIKQIEVALRNPELTKERKAELLAEKAKLERSVYEAKVELATVDGKESKATLTAENQLAKQRIAEIRKALTDPELTKERKAELKAEKAQLEQAVKESHAKLAELGRASSTSQIKANTADMDGKVTGTQNKLAALNGASSTSRINGNTTDLDTDYSNSKNKLSALDRTTATSHMYGNASGLSREVSYAQGRVNSLSNKTIYIRGQATITSLSVSSGVQAKLAAAGMRLLAGGGYVSGPGTSTSDSILARLSNGEYVVNARAVGVYGKSFMDALNNLSFGAPATAAPAPRAAAGYSPPAGGGRPAGAGEIHLHLHSPIIGSQEDLARYITDAQLRYRRDRGGVPLGLG